MTEIIAIVTTRPEQMIGGGVPTFIEENLEQLEKTAFLLEKILDAAAHNLKNGAYILVSR